jgi:DNA-binding Lrp family transcriptional regulator
MRAYVLVTVRPGNVRDIVQQIKNLSGVKSANACWGMPDVFVVAEVESADELNKLVIGEIQSLEGVERTETHIAIE